MANRLSGEQSPYLLQHAHNPVDWYPWGDEAFERAKKENKPVLISIGYAACHWCHVMERESFEDAHVAAYMNAHFINIKVDREEHPDVDHMYMDAVQAITGSGGWPLNVFATPERIPFYGGTYFPPRPAFNRVSWMQLLESLRGIWQDRQDEVTGQTQQMLQYLKQVSTLGTAKENVFHKESCRKMAENLLANADKENGGFGRAPKFPATMAIRYLLEHHYFTKHEDSLQQALQSLQCMVRGGIYDQLGGGFARYATDDNWLIPHFEKMLYDNALLVPVLCDAYSVTKDPFYKTAAEETIAFVQRELRSPEGGYYSALDADSEGIEGKFYTWTWEDWQQVFPQGNKLVAQYFGIMEDGNWEHTNILHVPQDLPEVAEANGVPPDEAWQRIAVAKEQLFRERAGRVRPLTDDKSLLSWNALMNLAISKAAAAFGNDEYRQTAGTHMQWIMDSFFVAGSLMHVWKKGVARIPAKLDDYAYLVQALIQLASVTGANSWLLTANELTDTVMQNFLHEDGDFFYYTSSSQTDIPVRKVDMYDGATPSANAVMAENLLLLGMSMERTVLTEQAVSMLQKMAGMAVRYPSSFGHWAHIIQRYMEGIKTVISTGKNAELFQTQLELHYLPHIFSLTLKKEISDVPLFSNKFLAGESCIFVCTEQACLPPVYSTDAALQIIGI